MSALFTVDKVLRVPDYHDAVVKATINRTPLQNLLKRGAKPTDWLQEVEVEKAVAAQQLAAAEGGDFNESNLDKRTSLVLKHQLQKWRSAKGWCVTRESEMMPSHTELRGEKAVARQMRIDAEELVASVENAISSEQEAVERGSGADTVPKTRGLMCWLKKLDTNAATTHPVQTVDASLLPVAGIDGDLEDASTFNEDLFRKECVKAALQAGDDNLSLVGLCGIYLKALMSDWMGKATAVNGVENLFSATRDAGSKKVQFIVDEFSYDGVTVRTMVDNHLLADTTTNLVGDAGRKSGAFIRPELWSIDTLEPLTNYDLPDKGAGKRGYHEAILRLACRNPVGQFRLKHVASA